MDYEKLTPEEKEDLRHVIERVFDEYAEYYMFRDACTITPKAERRRFLQGLRVLNDLTGQRKNISLKDLELRCPELRPEEQIQAEIRQLHAETGAVMLRCKQAWMQAAGDVNVALKNLRKKPTLG